MKSFYKKEKRKRNIVLRRLFYCPINYIFIKAITGQIRVNTNNEML